MGSFICLTFCDFLLHSFYLFSLSFYRKLINGLCKLLEMNYIYYQSDSVGALICIKNGTEKRTSLDEQSKAHKTVGT